MDATDRRHAGDGRSARRGGPGDRHCGCPHGGRAGRWPAGSVACPGLQSDPGVAAAFARLLQISTLPRGEAQGHPVFVSIVGQISPDEARVMRFFATDPKQPLIHVRAVHRYGLGTTLVLENFSLISQDAGCHHPELCAAYLDNL